MIGEELIKHICILLDKENKLHTNYNIIIKFRELNNLNQLIKK